MAGSFNLDIQTNRRPMADLDISFVRAFYSDFEKMAEQDIVHHCSEHEVFTTPFAYIADVKERGLLPEDFTAIDYRRANGDLYQLSEEWQLVRHFVDYGRHEGRK